MRVKEFVKWDKKYSIYVIIYDSDIYTEEEIDKYIKHYTQNTYEKREGIFFMLRKDWYKLHEMILKDYIPKEV